MTHGYPFERKVVGFASRLAARLAGPEAAHGFLMTFDSSGSVRTVQFERPADGWNPSALEEVATGYLFYDPFDPAEYTWLSWSRIDRATMERLLGEPFTDADFVKDPQATVRSGTLDPPNTYPNSWGVMF
jgi:hypothetical protein